MNLRLLLIATLVGLGVRPPATRAAPAPVPDRNARLVSARLFHYMSYPYVSRKGVTLEGLYADFDQALGVLAGFVTDDEAKRCERLESVDLRAKLALIARDRRRRPELYRHLQERYRFVRDRRTAGTFQHPHFPAAEECVGANRLAWEYFVLRPNMGYASAFPAQTALVALARIGDEASLPAMAHFFRTSWQAYEALKMDTQTAELLVMKAQQAVESIRTERGLRTQLELFAWVLRRVPSGRRLPEWLKPADRLRNDFTRREYEEQWRRVLRKFQRDSLPSDQRRLLEEALKSAMPDAAR